MRDKEAFNVRITFSLIIKTRVLSVIPYATVVFFIMYLRQSSNVWGYC